MIKTAYQLFSFPVVAPATASCSGRKNTSVAAPKSPSKMPKTLLRVRLTPKNSAPKMSIHNGVVVFKMPANELLMCCCAYTNKNAGIVLPHNPTIVVYIHLSCGISLWRTAKIVIKKILDNPIRIAATSSHEKTANPRFIKKNEQPQVTAKNTSNAQSKG